MGRLAELGFPIAVLVVAVLAVTAMPVAALVPSAFGGSAADGEDAEPPVEIPDEHEPPSIPDEATATVDGQEFDRAQEALDAAEPGDEVVLEGQFDEHLVVETDDVTVRASERGAVVDGGGEGRVLTVAGEDVTVKGLWVRDSGYDVGTEDAGVFVAGDRATLADLYLSEIAFGVWVDGADEVTAEDNRIEGREDVPEIERGNGIHLWNTEDTVVRNNEITTVKDGIYYSWAERVVSEGNTFWDSRFGVHYMYSNDNRLADNVAVDNDVGFALMVSEGLEIENNVALRNTGASGHGIFLKDVDHSEIRGNDLVGNERGLFVYNSYHNAIEDNLVQYNVIGVHTTAGSDGQEVLGNSFVDNDEQVLTTTTEVETWNGSDGGNYWSDARTADLTGDETSELRHRPAGLVEHIVAEQPQAAVFADSPAFEAVRMAEDSFPVVEAPGVVDHHPLTEPPHDPAAYEGLGQPDAEPDETEPDVTHQHDHGHGDGDDHPHDDGDDHPHDGGDSEADEHDDHGEDDHENTKNTTDNTDASGVEEAHP